MSKKRLILVLCALLMSLYTASVVARVADWDEAEVVAAVFADESLVPGITSPFIVPDDDLHLMADVRTVEWRAMGEVDLVAIATRQGGDWLYVGDVDFECVSRFTARVCVSEFPRQVKGEEKLVFLCGGFTYTAVRRNLWHVLAGIGPKYALELEYHAIS